jgi:SAM-dependent methyltransferase
MMHDTSGLTCRLCASNKVKLIFRLQHQGNLYTVINCQDCDLLQTLEHYDAVSPNYLYLSEDKIDEDHLWCQGAHKIPAFQQWWTHARILIKNREQNLRLLDIGCGTGGFLKYARAKGIEVYGFDASAAQVRYAQGELANIRQAASLSEYLESLDSPEIRFDIITLWDVLEHIRNPLEFLLSLRDVLQPDGLLYISVPNGRAMHWKRRIYAMLGQNRDREWAPWEHVFYYSPTSLKSCLKKSGFEPLQGGAVSCYPRPISAFELIRRAGFLIFSWFPSQSPQIYIWAQ